MNGVCRSKSPHPPPPFNTLSSSPSLLCSSLQQLFLRALVLWCSKKMCASPFRWQGGMSWGIWERREGQPLQGRSSLSLEGPLIFFLAKHSSGSSESTWGLRKAFSWTGKGLALHNQRRRAGREAEGEGGRHNVCGERAADKKRVKDVKMIGQRNMQN